MSGSAMSTSKRHPGPEIISDRMVELIRFAIKEKAGGISNLQDASAHVGMTYTNLSALMNGDRSRSFKASQVLSMVLLTGVDVNWVYGFTNVKFNDVTSLPLIDQLKHIVAQIESELNE